MYINFGKVNYLNKLIKYELNNYDNKNTITIWELGNTFPSVGDDVHPNQFGYKLIFKDIISYIDKKYIITQKEN
jgi:lysophospholipase L1-like esterase